MLKIRLKIEGMACGLCEAHINEAIRKEFNVKKVTSSHAKGITEILCEAAIEEDLLRTTVENTGYRVLDVAMEPYEKKGFSLFKR